MFSLLFKATFQDGFLIGIQVLFSNLYVKLNLLSHIAQWNFHSELLISMDLYGSLISMGFSTDMNSSLVILMSSWIFYYISHNVILFAVSFKATQSKFCPFKSRCPIETFPAYLKMKYCLLFHLKLWIFEKNSSFVFKSSCQIGSFVTYLTMEFCLFFSSKLLFRMDFWYEFKSCPFQTSCQTESLVAYLTMEPCVLFHDMNFWSEFKSCFKIWMSNWIFCLISHNGMFIQSFLSEWISGGFVRIFDLYRFQVLSF